MKQPDPYYFEAMWLVFSIQNLTRLVRSFLWHQNSIDQAVPKISIEENLTLPPCYEDRLRIRMMSIPFNKCKQIVPSYRLRVKICPSAAEHVTC